MLPALLWFVIKLIFLFTHLSEKISPCIRQDYLCLRLRRSKTLCIEYRISSNNRLLSHNRPLLIRRKKQSPPAIIRGNRSTNGPDDTWAGCLAGGVLLTILVGVCRPVLQILTLFQTKKCNFPHPFSDQTSKIHTRFQTWPLDRNYVIIT